MNKIGIMQGRLSPPDGKIQSFPWKTWEEEFPKAKEVGLDCIDWIVQTERMNENPIFTQPEKILELIAKTGVTVDAVCADYFMELSLPESLQKTCSLIETMAILNILYLEVPLLESSSIKSKEELKQAADLFKVILNHAWEKGITLAFETDLMPTAIAGLLRYLNHPAAKANYDTGNRASYGFNPHVEFYLYGKFIRTVHIKDRILRGGSVSLGRGAVNFPMCFNLLKIHGYTGPLFIQAARDGDEMKSAKRNLQFVKEYL